MSQLIEKKPAVRVRHIILAIIVFVIAFKFVNIVVNKTSWEASAGTSVYAGLDESGSVITYAFLPDNMLLTTEADDITECIQLGTYTAYKGHKIFWRYWYTPIPEVHWGKCLFLVEPGYVPVVLNLDVKKSEGQMCKGFYKRNRTNHLYMTFSRYDMRYKSKSFIRLLDEKVEAMGINETFEYIKEMGDF